MAVYRLNIEMNEFIIDPTLTALSLSCGRVGGTVGVTALAEALKSNTKLTALDLNENGIDDRGASALAEALKKNTTLTTLYLHYNQIGDEGATALAEALKVNTTLTTLRLCRNRIGNKGATALAEALEINTHLATLRLRNSRIGGRGAAALAKALKKNTTLTVLALNRKRIGDQEVNREIAKFLARNRYLVHLDPILAQFLSLQSCSELVAVLDANNDDPSVLFDLIRSRNDWMFGRRPSFNNADQNLNDAVPYHEGGAVSRPYSSHPE